MAHLKQLLSFFPCCWDRWLWRTSPEVVISGHWRSISPSLHLHCFLPRTTGGGGCFPVRPRGAASPFSSSFYFLSTKTTKHTTISVFDSASCLPLFFNFNHRKTPQEVEISDNQWGQQPLVSSLLSSRIHKRPEHPTFRCLPCPPNSHLDTCSAAASRCCCCLSFSCYQRWERTLRRFAGDRLLLLFARNMNHRATLSRSLFRFPFPPLDRWEAHDCAFLLFVRSSSLIRRRRVPFGIFGECFKTSPYV